MAVLRQHEYALGVVGGEDARHVAVLVEGQLHLADYVALDVVAVHADGGIRLAGHGVFVGVGAGVGGVGVEGGRLSAIEGEGVLAHGRLVIANPREHRGVGVEGEGAVEGELLFVDPVGLAVDDFVVLAVLRHLYLGVVEEQFHEEEVVLPDEGHHGAIGGEGGHLLRPAVG